MAFAWKRLIDNTFCAVDITLLQHEYTEALLMDVMHVDSQTAHSIANKYFNWDILLEKGK